MIEIITRPDYEQAVQMGFNPLLDWRNFKVNFLLRVTLQKELFGSSDFQVQNDKFYHWAWENSIKCCAETGKPLHNYSSVYISHIISRGSDRRMSIDCRNFNILSFNAHQQWESSKNKKMNIWRMNQLVIKLLKEDYNL